MVAYPSRSAVSTTPDNLEERVEEGAVRNVCTGWDYVAYNKQHTYRVTLYTL